MMQGIVGSIIATILVAAVVAAYRRLAGQQIRITHPRSGETLTDPEPLGEGQAFPVRGTLRRLPTGNEIWLLTEDESTGKFWPQGFFNVQYDHQRQTWMGKISSGGRKNIRIVAVVAPSTSQDFFRYYQAVGVARGYRFDPLQRVPVDCKNRTAVQASFP
jgi:hypothetical protein